MIPLIDDQATVAGALRSIEQSSGWWCGRWRLLRLYLALGWYFLPLCWPSADGGCGCGHTPPHRASEIGKAPLVSVKRLGRLPTPADAQRWFHRWPSANIGVLLQPSGLLVIDADSRAAIDEATALGLPTGPRAARSQDRLHVDTAAPAGAVGWVTRKGRSGAIDVLAGYPHTGHVVVPPSVHRSGQTYHWIVEPGTVPLPPAPDWAVAFLGERSPTRASATVVLPTDLPAVDVNALAISEFTRSLILHGLDAAPGKFKSRSELVCAVILGLIRAGCDNPTVASVLLDPRYVVSEKPSEQGSEWLATEIGRIREKVRSGDLTLGRGCGERAAASKVIDVEIG